VLRKAWKAVTIWLTERDGKSRKMKKGELVVVKDLQ